MKTTSFFLLFFLLVSSTADLLAADWKTLDGTYAITAKNYLDPSDEEPKDSHIRFQLRSDIAKELYQAMKTAEKPDECTGALAKKIGQMQCLYYKNEKKYECSFSIDIVHQTIEYGVAC